MKAYILNVGNEVLSGKVINTNSAFLAKALRTTGIETAKTVVVGDDKDMLIREFTEFENSDAEILITTGGLGPTHDDLTKETLAKHLNLPLVLIDKAKELLDSYFGSQMAECNLKQAYFPEGAIILENRVGTADGAIIEHHHKLYIVLVGPPAELEPMVMESVLPYLKNRVPQIPLSQDYIVMGGTESGFEERLQPLYRKYPYVSIAPYASLGKIRYEITAPGNRTDEFLAANHEFEAMMDGYIISRDNEDIEIAVVNLLKEKHYRISFAESCTGGMLASAIVNVPGASDVFSVSFVTYSNQAKTDILGVRAETISEYGVVSEETVREMATGLYHKTAAEICVSVSGIAGPGGGTAEKPVGLVHYAILDQGKMIAEQKVFRGNREMIRKRSMMWILYRVWSILKND